MSSTGQAIGMVIGAVVGIAFPVVGFALGAAIGGALGALIDPPKGQDVVGPRLEDLTVQTSTYGAVMPRLKGTVAVTGNVFWLEGDALKENKKTKKVGGKGGGSAKQTTYTYSATFAVGLSHQISGPVSGIRRLWLGNKLVYDAGSGNTDSTIASLMSVAANLLFGSAFGKDGAGAASGGIAWKLYNGSDPQDPDPRMQADKGVANVSGYPGRCYIVFYDLDLTEHYQNTLMGVQAKVELVCGDPASASHTVVFNTSGLSSTRKVISAVVGPTQTEYAVARLDGFGDLYGVDYYTSAYGQYDKLTGSIDYSIANSFGWTYPGLLRCLQNRDGVLTSVIIQGQYSNYETRFFFIKGGAVSVSRLYTDAEINYGHYQICATDADETYLADDQSACAIVKLSGTSLVASSSVAVHASAIALSENRVFVLNYAGGVGSSTVSIFDRIDLSLIGNYTSAVNGNGYETAIYPLSDDEFYLASGTYLSHWVNGAGTNLGAVLTAPAGAYHYRQFVLNRDPDVYMDFASSSGYEFAGTMTSYQLTQQPAKLRDIVTEECALEGLDATDLNLTELVDSDVRGYRVSTAGSVRSVLEQLQAAFPYDVIQSGYKVKFKSRGGASVLTIPESDLGAHVSGDVPPRFSMQTEMPSQVPAKVTFNFLNPDREYDPDEQSAAFTAQDVKNSYTVSLPLVMTPTEALQAADVLLKKEQIERTTVDSLLLPPTIDYLKLEAADVIDVVAQGRTHTIRLIKVTQRQDGVIECAGKLTNSTAYTSTAAAQDSLALGQTVVPLAGDSELVLLDVPRMTADQDISGLVAGMYGYTTGWPGGVALRSDDSGESFNAIAAFNAKTEVFTITGTPATVSAYAIDHATRLTATPDWTGCDLFSITETQLYALGNVAAYGADGRWEIVAFKTVVDNTGSYTLSNFLRGRFGTEWAMSLHVSGDKLVMLDYDALDFMGIPLTAINSPRLWRGVTSGASVDSVSDITDTYEGNNLKPLSPVDLSGDRHPSTFDWTITAQRRTRTPVELFSGATVPLGETSESYEMELWDSGYTTRKRLFSGLSSLSVPYPAADQITDWGLYPATLYVKAYQLSPVVGRGYALQASVFRSRKTDGTGYSTAVLSMAPLLYYKMDGNTTTITDSGSAASNGTASATNVTYQQTALLTGGTPGYSIKFTTGYISSPHIAGMNGGYTLVFLMQPSTLPVSESSFLHKGDYGVAGSQGHFYGVMPDGKLKMTWYNGASRAVTTTAAYFSAGVKAHVAIKYNGATSLSIYKNGALVETLSMFNAIVNNSLVFFINASKNTSIYGFAPTNTLDDFAWFSTQLTDTQISDLYEAS